MANIILSINAGSSSLKTTVFKEVHEGEAKKLQRLASAQIVRAAEGFLAPSTSQQLSLTIYPFIHQL
jgi:acetate kinase